MDAFSYLSVLISVILGLAITQILQGFRGLMLARTHVRGYWPCLLWAVILLLINVQSWWAMYGLRERTMAHWTFAGFAVVILQAILTYLLAGLVLPDFDRGKTLDLREHYYANHRWFFTLLVLFIATSIMKDIVLNGSLPAPMNLGFQLTFAVVSGICAWSSREWLHKLQAPLAAMGVVAYIVLLFEQLNWT